MSILLYILHPSTIPPKLVCLGIAGISIFSLLAALTAQFGFGLLPCKLCMIQRGPFAINTLLGLFGFAKAERKYPVIGVAGITFLINSAIASYHSGVERKWWIGLDGCSAPDMSGSIEDLLKRIQETDVVRCDEIPWSLFGLSMANYNAIMCLGLGIACLGYIWLRRNMPAPQNKA